MWLSRSAAALILLALAGCQPGSGSPLGWYLSRTAGLEVTRSIPGTVQAVVGGTELLSVNFATTGQSLSNLVISGGLPLPSDWTGPASFSCSTLPSGDSCTLVLAYAPSAARSGTLQLTYSFADEAGDNHSGAVSIPYRSTSNNNIVAAVSPIGQVAAVVGAASQSVQVTFTTDDGSPATGFAITSALSALPSGWSSASGASFDCATVSTGNGCALKLSYAPSSADSGTLTLAYQYTNDAGQSESGAVNIRYVASSSDSVVANASPSGALAVAVGGSQSVTVTFDTNDGQTATGFALTSSLASLPSGWSSPSGASFGCGSVSSGNGCQLSLAYAPIALASGVLSLSYTYFNNAGTAASGSINIPYSGTTNDQVMGTVTPAAAITATLNTDQDVNVTFNTNDGALASALSVTTNLAALPSGWSSLSGSSFSCTAVSSGNGCQLALSYAPTVAADGTLTLDYNYTNNAGSAETGSVAITYATNATIGGVLSGLNGTLELQVNGTDTLSLTADGGFTFPTPVASGGGYDVTVLSAPAGQTCVVSNGSGSASANVTNVGVSCSVNDFSVGGTISGLTQGGLVLTDNGGNALPVSSGSNAFTFSTQLAYGASYAVAVSAQPTGQTCSVSNGSGTITGAVTSVSVNCSTNTYSVGGTISGLTQGGLVLTDNGGNALPVSSGSSVFTFSTQLAYGASYAAAVSTQPTGQTCTVSSGSGTVTGPISSVSVHCTTNTYSVGGTISGLTQGGLVLTDNGGDALSVLAGASSFSFATQLAYGASWVAAVSTQPSGQTCTVSSGSGTVTGPISSISVHCTTNTYSVGGTISGLTQGGLVLTDNGGNALSVSSGSSSFTFSTQLAYGASYAVAVGTQPSGELCSVANGSGTVSATVTSVAISCVTSYTLGGTISGLNLSSVVLSNGGSTVTVTSGSSSWQFSSSFAANSNYSVNVQTQPSGEVCQVTGAASGVLTHNVSNVTVVCAMGLWTWQEGSNIANPDGTYGTERTPAASNIPGGRGNGAFWTDASGNFWLFGGAGYPASGSSSGYLNDLWMYSPGSGEWTWESGATTLNSNGVYGTKGVAAAGNAPGGRFRASQWTDAQGNLWLFGGTGYAASGGSAESLSDLWKYSPSSGEWTWVAGPSSGNNNGVYGTKGVAAAANTPGGRSGAAAWVDASGNLWLFGGAGYGASGGSGDLSDLWKFSPSSGEWTWVGGPSTINGSGTYGTKGVAAASNWPGSRFVGASWVDASGNFWLFGGIGYASSGSGNLSDLWQYSSSSGEWTWVSGASSVATYSVYGTQGVAAASNAPGSRYAAVSWIDASGNLWLFGGSGYAASTNGFLNDLWYYTPATGEWTWISGSQSAAQSGLYGTQGTASVSNLPGSRQESHVWLDSSGNLWLFGGYGYDSAGTNGELNDLWQFTLQ